MKFNTIINNKAILVDNLRPDTEDVFSVDGEFCVQWIEGGKIDESKCYYTDCKQDAICTVDSIKFENYSKQNNIFFN